MRIEKLERRQFAWGMTWVEVKASKQTPAKIAATLLDPEDKSVYTWMPTDQGKVAFGYAATKGQPKISGPLYSYAQALASKVSEGIYLAPIDNRLLWYVAVADGAVLPGTDVIAPMADAIAKVEQLRLALNLQVKVAEGFDLSIRADDTFDVALPATTKVRPMVSSNNVSLLKGVATLILLFGAVGGVGWWMFAPEDVPAVDPVIEAARQQRAKYLDSINGELARVPRNAGWASVAVVQAKTALDHQYAGWSLAQVECSPYSRRTDTGMALAAGCTGFYSPAERRPTSLALLTNRYGRGNVLVEKDGKVAYVSLPLKVDSGLAWTEEQISAPPRLGASLIDLVGVLPLRFAGVNAGNVTRESLSALYSAPGDMGTAYKETIVLTAQENMESMRLRVLLSLFSREGFVPVRVKFIVGTGGGAAAWEMELLRISGE